MDYLYRHCSDQLVGHPDKTKQLESLIQQERIALSEKYKQRNQIDEEIEVKRQVITHLENILAFHLAKEKATMSDMSDELHKDPNAFAVKHQWPGLVLSSTPQPVYVDKTGMVVCFGDDDLDETVHVKVMLSRGEDGSLVIQ